MDVTAVALWMMFWGAIGAFIGQTKGRATLGFLLGAVFSPLGLLFACFIRDRRTLCPHCRSPLLAADASVCAKCGRDTYTLPTLLTSRQPSPDDNLQALADARAAR